MGHVPLAPEHACATLTGHDGVCVCMPRDHCQRAGNS